MVITRKRENGENFKEKKNMNVKKRKENRMSGEKKRGKYENWEKRKEEKENTHTTVKKGKTKWAVDEKENKKEYERSKKTP